MKKVLKTCTILMVIFGIAGGICVVAAGFMGASFSNCFFRGVWPDYTEDVQKEYHFDKNRVKNLKIDTGSATLRIVQGGDEEITLTNKEEDVGMKAVLSDNGELKVERDGLRWFPLRWFQHGREAVLRIPKSVRFDHVKIEVGSGDVQINEMRTDLLKADVGSGNVSGEHIKTGDCEIDCGSGDVDLVLFGAKEEYECETDCGSGDITVENQSLSYNKKEFYMVNHKNKLKIDCGSGDVTISFQKEN